MVDSRHEFEKWYKSVDFVAPLSDAWQAACELKDKEVEKWIKRDAKNGVKLATMRDDIYRLTAEIAGLRKEIAQAGSSGLILLKEVAALNAELAELKEQTPVAWIYPSTLDDFKDNETFNQCYSIQVDRYGEVSIPLYANPIPTIPDGYALVPVEPTDEMIDLACDITDTYRVEMVRAYEAMIDAAQKEIK